VSSVGSIKEEDKLGGVGGGGKSVRILLSKPFSRFAERKTTAFSGKR